MKKINSNKITSILLGFVLLSGTLAFAINPTQAFAVDERENARANSVDATNDVSVQNHLATEDAIMSASASAICDVTSLPAGISDAIETGTSQGFPTAGNSYYILSSGDAGILVPGTAAGVTASVVNGNPDGLPFPADVQDGFGDDANDVATTLISCMIPVGVTQLTFDYGFGTEETPTFTPNSFSDYFRTVGALGNVLSLPNGAPITANNMDLFGYANLVTGSSFAPLPLYPSPDDTGLNAFLCTANSSVACAQPQVGVWNVAAFQGGNVVLGWEVADDADLILDSAAYIDNLDTDAAGEIVKTCDVGTNICKTVIIIEEVDDGVIAVNELITYEVTITAMNNLGEDILNAQVKDNFGGDVEISVPAQDDVNEIGDLTCTVDLKGKTEKAQVKCDANTFEDSEGIIGFSATVITDINPGQGNKSEPKREYTSCGVHDMNSGATLKGELADGTPVEFSTGSVSVEVFDEADLSGDCDGDGFTDGDEISHGTDPFDPADFPGCGGINTTDICLDGDGIATPQRGAFSAVWGDNLAVWPAPGGLLAEGIDWFDLDGDDAWTIGTDALHLERNVSCATGIPNASYDLGADCVLLDMGSNLLGGEFVDCDLDNAFACSAAKLAYLGTTGMKFVDGEVNLDLFYNNGEDIIIDVNGNGIFD